ncbi:uncharacterized protein LOC128990828 [Macrosteles quadrilineatus]|uniref:uncharacterized protein LOC128990634 n=1 Tax=Macrosteles quadrilineatus TaxID=74068 RepID=UPI0023E2FB4B|nr:uncharacterized protein LOC128990634 [Macrosteles quadrilineatus]XP_054269412.1 uncharacterized protein LOC128990828 [Macrosteles quadrilineatus]
MRIDNFEVHSCCFFIPLRTGAKLFGFISLVGCLVASFFSFAELVYEAKHHSYIEWMLVLELVALLVQMGTSVLLLVGTYQEQAKLIPPWLISTFVSAVLEVFFMPSVVGEIVGVRHRTITQWLIFTIFMLLDDIYGLLVVFSYYRSLSPLRQQSLV